MFTDMSISGKTFKALIDTGASHLLISDSAARKAGLQVVKDGGIIKAVNSAPTPIVGVAHKVNVGMGEWTSQEDVTVVRLDDYEVIVGLEFLERAKAVLIPHINTLCIQDGKGCTIPLRREKVTTKVVSAIQCSRGAGTREPTFERDGGTHEEGTKVDVPPKGKVEHKGATRTGDRRTKDRGAPQKSWERGRNARKAGSGHGTCPGSRRDKLWERRPRRKHGQQPVLDRGAAEHGNGTVRGQHHPRGNATMRASPKWVGENVTPSSFPAQKFAAGQARTILEEPGRFRKSLEGSGTAKNISEEFGRRRKILATGEKLLGRV